MNKHSALLILYAFLRITQSFGSDLESSKTENGLKSGHVVGIVNRSVEQIYKSLLDPMLTRNSNNTKVIATDISPKDSQSILKKMKHEITVKPFLFISVSWTEEWTYELLKGSTNEPETISITYQKTDGNSQIKQFGGHFEIKKIDDKSSEVTIDEQIESNYRTEKEVINGLKETLKIIRN